MAVYVHYRKARSRPPIRHGAGKAPALVGPSGTGKTLLCETLAGCLGVPFVTASATSLAQTRYVNDEIEAILRRLVDQAGGDDPRRRGIVFIDEIDKLRPIPPKAAAPRVASSMPLLLMEGNTRSSWKRAASSTPPISCSFRGAFVGLDTIMAQGAAWAAIGATEDDNQAILDRLNRREAHRPFRVRPDSGIHRPVTRSDPVPTSAAIC